MGFALVNEIVIEIQEIELFKNWTLHRKSREIFKKGSRDI